MLSPTPKEALELHEQWAEVYRREQRWEQLYETIVSILSILRSFPNIVDNGQEKMNKYKRELLDVERLIADRILNDEKMISQKIFVMKLEIEELFSRNASAEAIMEKMRRFFAMGEALSEILSDAAFVIHFESSDIALQLWEAHLSAVWCYLVIHSSGVYYPAFSVVTCRIPDWVIELWSNTTKQQRYKIVEKLLLISEFSKRFDRFIAFENQTEWLREVRQWLLWHGRWRAAKCITQLIRQIEKRSKYYTQQGFSSTHWLLPVPEGSPTPDESNRVARQTTPPND
mgnify:CR=1 FL=1